MYRSLRSSLPIVALLLALLTAPVSAAPAPAPGNSAAAKACQNGGYAKYVGPDGTPFRNPGECVQFVAHGGTLRPPAASLVVTFASWFSRGYLVTLTGYAAGDIICLQEVFTGTAPDYPLTNYCVSATPAPPLTVPVGSYVCQGRPSDTIYYLIARVEATGQEGRLQLPPCP